MPAALPVIAAGVTIASGLRSLSAPSAPQLPPPPPTLTWEEAREEARRVLDPLFGEHLKNALKAVDKASIRRGFFGQLPGAALSRSTAADIATRQAQAIGELTGHLQGMTAQQAAQHAQMALQRHQQNLLADQQRLSGLGTALQGLGQIQNLWPHVWAQWFPGSTFAQNVANAGNLLSMGYGMPGTVNPSTTFRLTPPVPTSATYSLPSLW